ncbi:isocitrate/isopropylmalate dehydrogenase family protein [Azospirillum canadense]|uniref:isocitrate/isopropylmalate dehydrogenase family protein n=1 Tax=Azospirillum canadense TaxID=403962 RepID=UPI0022278440|nr:isocitrate/isopropylmalate dehydrogenase family protein [Azospirillum canadense]MCW2240513.1 3-isopropylmalate dehydrogenase [Azospirillum canadense]
MVAQSKKKVLVLPGEGIGIEVTDATMRVARAVDLPWDMEIHEEVNSKVWMETGVAMPESLVGDLKAGRYDAILFGAIGSPAAPEGVVERATLLRLRFELKLALNVRPLRLAEGLPSPLASGARIDAVVVRENTEGAYVGASGVLNPHDDDEVAVTTSVSTRSGVERAIEYAFGLAMKRRRNLCLVHKANVIQHEGALWRRVFDTVAKRYPEVKAWYMHVDAATMRFVTRPQDFDVVVTENVFGDILTDLGAALAGGIGLAPSSNINPVSGLGLFEPIHGTAPDIAGQGKANPLAMIRSLSMCAAHLGHDDLAQVIYAATDTVAPRTDLTTTEAWTSAVVAALR